VCIIVPGDMLKLMDNIRGKFIEGIYINPIICSYLDLAHGVYQSIEANYKYKNIRSTIFYINYSENENKTILNDLLNMFENHLLISYTSSCDLSFDMMSKMIDLEIYFNRIIYQAIIKKNINQCNWPGKNKQNIIYNKIN